MKINKKIVIALTASLVLGITPVRGAELPAPVFIEQNSEDETYVEQLKKDEKLLLHGTEKIERYYAVLAPYFRKNWTM